MYLSHWQIETWEQCQLKWAHGKVYKSPAAPSDALILGTAIHAALEADGAAWIEGQRHIALDGLLDVFAQTLQSELALQDPDGLLADHVDGMHRRGHAMLAAYVAHVQPRYAPQEVELTATFSVDAITFTGRIDAITPKAIVDWKTASRPWADDAAAHKDQASAYLAARPDQTQVTFIVFACSPDDPDVCVVRTHPTTRTPAQLAAYQDKVRAVAAEIAAAKAAEVFLARTTPLCGWCGYLGSCPLGRAWLDAAGRRAAVPVVTKAVPA